MKLKYFPEIDSLRAIAVLMVLFHHFFSEKLLLGNTGVDIFFVLSGFLITGILLNYKERKTFNDSIKTFYYRRFLRIFPIYYLFIIAAWLLQRKMLHSGELFAVAGYYYNFYIIGGGETSAPFNHLWSLSVEEQFYIFWPFVILLTPKRFIKVVIIGFIIGSIAFSVSNMLFFHVKYASYMHLVSCVQALGLGGLLAYYQREQPEKLAFAKEHNTLLLLGCILCILCTIAFYKRVPVLFSFTRTSNAFLTFFILVRLTMMPLNNVFGKVMQWGWLQLLGRISYGVYLYHNLIKVILEPYFRGTSAAIKFPLYSLVTIGIAYLSFIVIERPINRLKG